MDLKVAGSVSGNAYSCVSGPVSGVRGCVIPDSLARKRPPLGRLDGLLFEDFHFADVIRLRRGFFFQDRVQVLASSNSIYLPEPLALRAARRSLAPRILL
jgi:hypothetical protein